DGKLALAIAGLARKGGVFAACKSPRPQKIDVPRCDVCRPPRNQMAGLCKSRNMIIVGGRCPAVTLARRILAVRFFPSLVIIGSGLAPRGCVPSHYEPSSLGATR